MAGILWMLSLCLLVQQSFCSLNDATGCLKWRQAGSDVCCDECHQGHRLVRECGPDPKKLCTRCEFGTFTTQPKAKQCMSCRQCVGALVLVKSCTESSDTVCGCEKGLRCGDKACNFCVTECGKGQEPIGRGCSQCPPRTFNDQIHEKCKPWSTKCPNQDQKIIAFGNAVSDIKCANISTPKKTTVDMEQKLPLMLLVVFGVVLICIIIILVCKAQKRRQMKEIQEETGETLSGKITGPPSEGPEKTIYTQALTTLFFVHAGAFVPVKRCTESSGTGCEKGLRCGDKACNFCVTECREGEEPDGCGCSQCPPGTFNDQIHEKCKPWSTKCPNQDQEIIASGDAVSDIKCANISTPKVYSTEPTVEMEQSWPLLLPVVFGVVLICIIIILGFKAQQRTQTKEIQEETGETPGWKIIEPPSDDPRTLIAIECSFHEAQQEQGSSSESLASKDSSEQLLPSYNRNGKN